MTTCPDHPVGRFIRTIAKHFGTGATGARQNDLVKRWPELLVEKRLDNRRALPKAGRKGRTYP